MDIRTIGLLGAIAGATTIVSAHAAHAAPAAPNETAASLTPASYTELLGPVADPIAQLKAQDAALREQDARGPASEDASGGDVRRVDQYQRHHHHHHHPHQQRRSYHSH